MEDSGGDWKIMELKRVEKGNEGKIGEGRMRMEDEGRGRDRIEEK